MRVPSTARNTAYAVREVAEGCKMVAVDCEGDDVLRSQV